MAKNRGQEMTRLRRTGSFLLASVAAIAALLTLTACGGGSSSTTTPPPTPTITAPVTIFPGTANVPVDGTAQFSDFYAGAPTATFSWSVSAGSGVGTIDSST